MVEDDDCDDNDEDSTILDTDRDCDGVVEEDDCDDRDAESTVVEEDGTAMVW